MFHFLSDKLVDQMMACKTIDEESREIYQYGVYNMISTAFHVISILLIGAIFHMFLECTLFYVCYTILRKFAGGYHASTSFRCYLCSCLVTFIVIFAMKFATPFLILELLILFVVSSGISVFCLAPVESPNKPLDEAEREHFRKSARIIWLLEAAAVSILWTLGFSHWAFAIGLGLAVLVSALIMGKMSVSGHMVQQEKVH